ncbi:MAG: hypothetical protein GX682_03280 [Clostridiaceae bacterium]|nr:hypothetical protein [Clostridiaceae bacterium]
MNQILYTNNEKKKGGQLEINVVLRIFAILCIVFGIILVGQASFAMINKKDLSESIPLVEITKEGNTLLLNVKHDKLIDKIIYNWNNDTNEIVLQGKGRTQLEESIKLPIGINTLMLKVIDIEGKTVSYNQNYELEEGDVTNPEIELLVDGAKVKIVVKDETELDYMAYYWNNEDQTKIQVREESPKQIEEKISILKGENTLTIIAVDKSGNEGKKEQTFKGTTRPVINLARDEKILIINVTDEEGLQKLEYTLNGVYYSTDPNNEGISLNRKELEIKQALNDGENKITIKAYNINGLDTEVSGEATI